MRKLVVMALILLTSAGLAYAKDYELQKKAGDLTFDIRVDKNPPIMGNNVMQVAIKDASGKPVTDATVSVSYTMPPMQGMAPMNYKSNAELQGEAYRSTLNFSMSGPWNVEVRAVRGGKTTPVKFNVDVK
jgi:Cu(I)/Ag(I) efflux system membrane fusion protein